MTALCVALAAVAFSCGGASPVDLHAIPNQNVLLITIDTLRADALGCYGGPAATPALDRLAAEGIRFDFAHAHAVTTLASHASILTGSPGGHYHALATRLADRAKREHGTP